MTAIPADTNRRLVLPLPDGGSVTIEGEGGRRTLRVGERPPVALEIAEPAETPSLRLAGPAPAAADLWGAAYWAFSRRPDCARVLWPELAGCAEAAASGLVAPRTDGPGWQSLRAMFWQLPRPWRAGGSAAGYPLAFTLTDGRRHPIRPPKPAGTVYRRFDARLGAWVSLRTLDIDGDLVRFNRWQNTPRVLRFWQEGGDLAAHRAYLARLAADPHTLTLIGCFDDEPFAYFEAYWAKEDRIAPFYPAGDHDRGVHMLVGEQAHRGPHRVASWLPALVHYLFLDEPRTQTVVAEPRADNQVMIGYMQAHGFNRDKEFDFPHKRAALMALSRERFFDRCRLS
ncbi:GNAT family N-acetyltransferase [Azospirillum sp. ST 5-10]|uniref:GNAT family N-acetyltransferase n=1 Tax=unclassified Azospirillum TaxID=2630922 RepID=UPI003F49EE27